MPSLISAATFAIIAGTMDLHAMEARRRQWCLPQQVGFDRASTPPPHLPTSVRSYTSSVKIILHYSHTYERSPRRMLAIVSVALARDEFGGNFLRRGQG